MTWDPVDNDLHAFTFNPDGLNIRINDDILCTLKNGTPIDFYYLFIDDEIISLIVTETNRYANKKLALPYIKTL